jgi:hypothetical protein
MRQSAAALPVTARPARAINRNLSILDILGYLPRAGAATTRVEIGGPSPRVARLSTAA